MGLAITEFEGWRSGWRKPDRRPIYEWARDYLTLPSSYAIAGKFDVSISRPLVDVFDAISDPLVRRVRFRKPPRFGGSLVADIAIPWVCVNDPGPVMWNWQKEDAAREHMKEKAWPLWLACEPFKTLLPRTRHDITATEIYFGPFFLKCQGANPNNLQGKGIRWQFNDEIWLPVWQGLYGQAVARTRDYARTQSEKIVDVSQAGNAGDVEDRNWREGHRAVWAYRSPKDGKHYPLVMSGKREDKTRFGIVWNQDAQRRDGTWNRGRVAETVRYVCGATGHEWPDTRETVAEWNRDGRYVTTNPEAARDVRSYSVTALMNNTMADLALRKVAAMEQASFGDMTGMREVKQQDESLPWEEEHLTVTIDGKASGYRTADYADGKQIEGERMRTLMADRQQGMRGDSPHRWCEVRAWRVDGTSQQLYYGRVDTKEAMRDLQLAYKVKDRCTWQDAGFERHRVFEECAEFGWIACFGSDQTGWTHLVNAQQRGDDAVKMRLPYSPWQRTTALGRVVNYLLFSEDYMADILANLIAGRGVAYEHPDDAEESYKEQMRAEHKVQKAGKFTLEKITSNKPNHAWDCAKMGVCFALLMKLLSMPVKPGGAAEKEAET